MPSWPMHCKQLASRASSSATAFWRTTTAALHAKTLQLSTELLDSELATVTDFPSFNCLQHNDRDMQRTRRRREDAG